MTAAEATQAGFHQLTSPYARHAEAALLAGVIADLERGGIGFELIPEGKGKVSVWRKGWIQPTDPTRSLAKGIRR